MRRILPLLLSALLLAGCAPPPPVEGEVYEVYFTSSTLGSPSLLSESRTVPQGVAPAEGLLRILLSGPVEEGLTSPIPAGTALLSWSLEEDGVLKVDLSERYGGLAGVSLTLADYALALTLCQLPEVEGVSITVEGEAVSFRARELLRPSDIVLSGAEDAPFYVAAPLYFPLRGGGLTIEERELLVTEYDSLASVLLAALLEGPEGADAFLPLPQGTEVLDAGTDGGVCYVDFSAPFAAQPPADQEEARLLLYAIVNTLCAQESITAVHLMVEGAVLPSYGGIPTEAPLEARPELALEGASLSGESN